MIRKLAHGLSAASLKWMLAWLVILSFCVGPITFLAILNANPDFIFWFVPYPPVPSGAINVQHLASGSMGGYRTIQFETDQPAEKIQQFYRTELPKHGWRLLCSPTQLEQPGCPLGRSSVVELADAYKRDDEPSRVRVINISIFKPGENLPNSQNRLVEVIEYNYPLPTP